MIAFDFSFKETLQSAEMLEFSTQAASLKEALAELYARHPRVVLIGWSAIPKWE